MTAPAVPTSRPRGWLLFRGVPLVALFLSSFVVLYANWVGQASSVEDPVGDAIVVHAGQSDRLSHGIDLMDDGAAPTLVVMFGGERRSLRQFCGQTEPYEVLCPQPTLSSTLGEARALGDLVAERGWETVVVVTSDYHLRRASYLDHQCSGAEVVRSGAGQGVTRLEVVLRIAEEMVAMVPAVLAGCEPPDAP